MELVTCVTCKQNLPPDEFYFNAIKKRHELSCKVCKRKAMQAKRDVTAKTKVWRVKTDIGTIEVRLPKNVKDVLDWYET